MKDTPVSHRRLPRRVMLAFLYAWVSLLILVLFIFYPGINEYQKAKFPDMVYGRAHRPYVMRALVPAAVRLITAATPERIREIPAQRLATNRYVRRLNWQAEYLFEFVVALALMWACFVAFAWCVRALLVLYYDPGPVVRDIAPLFALLGLPLFFIYCSYPYDPATLLLYTAAVLLLARAELSNMRPRTLVAFYAVFILATINKETSVLLVLLFAISQWSRLPRRAWLAHTLVLAAIWLASRLTLVWIFASTPRPEQGTWGLAEFHLFDHNLKLLRSPIHLARFVLVLLFFGWMVGRSWSSKPVFLRRGLLLTFLPLFGMSLFLGYCNELRGYYEAWPFVFALAFPTVMRDLGCHERVSPTEGSIDAST